MKTNCPFTAWRKDGVVDAKHGLEPFENIGKRADLFLESISELTGKILVVSHGYLTRVLLANCVLGLPVNGFEKIWLSNASCSILTDSEQGLQIRAINSTNVGFFN